MDKRIVVATHGGFAEGIKTSLSMIFGDATPIECVSAYVDLSVDYGEQLARIVREHDYEHAELVVLTDVLGGSVNNEFMKLLGSYRFHLVTGLNLALLLEVVSCPAEQLAESLPDIVATAREHIVLCNDLVTAQQAALNDEDLNDF